jgi:hypothetical protein
MRRQSQRSYHVWASYLRAFIGSMLRLSQCGQRFWTHGSRRRPCAVAVSPASRRDRTPHTRKSRCGCSGSGRLICPCAVVSRPSSATASTLRSSVDTDFFSGCFWKPDRMRCAPNARGAPTFMPPSWVSTAARMPPAGVCLAIAWGIEYSQRTAFLNLLRDSPCARGRLAAAFIKSPARRRRGEAR